MWWRGRHAGDRYVSGYGCRVGRCAGASNLSLVLVDATNHTIIATIWDSPALNNASYDSFQGYSSSVTGSATGLRLRTTRLTQLALLMRNNQHNLQIPIESINMSITWGEGKPGPWSPAPMPGNTVCENIWSRPLANGDVALAFVNQGSNATMVCDAACFAAAGLGGSLKGVKVRDMIAHADLPPLSPPFVLRQQVAGQGSAAAFRLTPVR